MSHSLYGECDIYAGLLAKTFLLDLNSHYRLNCRPINIPPGRPAPLPVGVFGSHLVGIGHTRNRGNPWGNRVRAAAPGANAGGLRQTRRCAQANPEIKEAGLGAPGGRVWSKRREELPERDQETRSCRYIWEEVYELPKEADRYFARPVISRCRAFRRSAGAAGSHLGKPLAW